MSEAVSDATIKAPKLGYYLIMANTLIFFTGLAAAIMARTNRDGCDEFLKSHYQYQIRTFFIGILYTIIAFLSTFILIGLLLFPVIMVWNLFRGFKGLKALEAGQPMPNPKTWIW